MGISLKIGTGPDDINLEEFQTWLTALRSGNYSQTHGRLQDKKGYCCLGVGGKVLIPEEKQYVDGNNFLMGGTLYMQGGAPLWLSQINRDLQRKSGKSLVALNDSDKLSFNQIADILEETYLTPYYESTRNSVQQ